MQINHDTVPHIYPELFTKSLGKYLLTYNAKSNKGVRILNPKAKIILKLINGKRNIKEINTLLYKSDLKLSIDDLIEGIDLFKKNAILYVNSFEPHVKISDPKTLNTWIHITNQCNLRCKYCYVSKTFSSMSLETGQKAIKAIFDSAIKHHFKKILFRFSGGESLLEYEKVIFLVHYAKGLENKYKIKTSYVVLTNGTLLTADRVKQFKKEKIHVFLSMDGLGKFQDLTRPFKGGQGSFFDVKRGLNLLLKHKISFNVSVVVTKYNLNSLPKFTKWLMLRNILVTFNFFRENCNTPLERDLSDEEFIKGMKKVYHVIEKYLPKFSLINTILDSIQFDRPRTRGCGIGQSYIAIRQDGSISDCQMTLEKSIGNINSDIISTIRNNNQLEPKDLTSEKKIKCANCQWRYICAGGCALATFKTYGSFNVPSPYCGVYQALIPEVLKLEGKRILKYYQN